jgi:hypothetical protein
MPEVGGKNLHADTPARSSDAFSVLLFLVVIFRSGLIQPGSMTTLQVGVTAS